MPGDHGREVRNTLEQHAYGHQGYSPPVGRQGPREPQLGAHYGTEGAGSIEQLVPNRAESEVTNDCSQQG